jgi:hypothetical protein
MLGIHYGSIDLSETYGRNPDSSVSSPERSVKSSPAGTERIRINPPVPD